MPSYDRDPKRDHDFDNHPYVQRTGEGEVRVDLERRRWEPGFLSLGECDSTIEGLVFTVQSFRGGEGGVLFSRSLQRSIFRQGCSIPNREGTESPRSHHEQRE